jgi:hypothetical protein
MTNEITEENAVYRTMFTVEVFSRGPLDVSTLTLDDIAYEITEGNCIGDYYAASQDVVSPDDVVSEMIRIGNDGTFFED